MKIEMAAEILRAISTTASEQPRNVYKELGYSSLESFSEDCKRRSWLDLL